MSTIKNTARRTGAHFIRVGTDLQRTEQAVGQLGSTSGVGGEPDRFSVVCARNIGVPRGIQEGVQHDGRQRIRTRQGCSNGFR